MDKAMILKQLINADDKSAFYLKHMDQLTETTILLFDKPSSGFSEYINKKFGKYYLLGLGNYNGSYLLNQNVCSGSNWLKVSAIVYFDINMLSRLNSCIKKGKVSDISSFKDAMNYIKGRKYAVEAITASIERVSKRYSEDSFISSLNTFRKFVKCNQLDSNTDDIILDKNDEQIINNYIHVVNNYSRNKDIITQYKALYCMVAKACILKFQKINNKFDELSLYCLDTLNVVLINELYQLGIFLTSKNSVSTFQKLQISKGSKIIETIKNVTWDLYHVRLIEQIRPIVSYESNGMVSIELPFFMTNDKGMADYINANKLKMMIFEPSNKSTISIHEKNIYDISQFLINKQIHNKFVYEDQLRKERSKDVDLDAQIKSLNSTLMNIVDAGK